ncbi:MAG: ParB-like nuclease domain-containing protein, partial [Stigonema ocellatum SAG 48.90 = DSM 106950]|nr:ParB-like nuclease domain-containing protein [Stigonema ocellatum SAG 48.90 = DSM 106950]
MAAALESADQRENFKVSQEFIPVWRDDYGLTSKNRLVVSEKQDKNYSTRIVEYLGLDEIRRDGGTQPRSAINLQHIKLLEDQMEEGQQLEPVIVFYDGEFYWLADGFHRWYAHRNQQEEAIACIIHQGANRDAVLYSVGANADHKPALPRSREDKRRAVMTLLNDQEWKEWSDREIARQCKVHHNTVSKIRASLTGDLSSNTSLQSLTGDLSSNTSLQSLTGDLSSNTSLQSLTGDLS